MAHVPSIWPAYLNLTMLVGGMFEMWYSIGIDSDGGNGVVESGAGVLAERLGVRVVPFRLVWLSMVKERAVRKLASEKSS